MQGYLW